MAADIVIRDAPDEGRFVAELDGQTASIWYECRPGVMRFVRADISHRFVVDGVGTQLMRVALVHARERHLLVEPCCTFAADYMRHHPDTHDLLSGKGWRLLGR